MGSLDSDIWILVIQGYVDSPPRTRISGYWLLRAMWTTLLGLGYLDIGHSGLCGQPSSDTDIRILVTQGYVDNPPWTRISGYWSFRAMWTALLGHGYPDIGYSGLCGQPSLDSDIRILVIQGYVDNPPRTRISGHWLLRAMWSILLRHGYPDIGHSGLCHRQWECGEDC